MTVPESVEYSTAADAALPPGTIIPGIVMLDNNEEKQGDAQCRGLQTEINVKRAFAQRLHCRVNGAQGLHVSSCPMKLST
jgi:hypothetical protein